MKLKQISKGLIQGGCIAAISVIGFAGLQIHDYMNQKQERIDTIRRESYGKQQLVKLEVDGLSEDGVIVEVQVEPRSYTKEEVILVFEEIMDEIEDVIKGNNTNLHQLQTDLNLVKTWEKTGIELEWRSFNTERINNEGKLVSHPDHSEEIVLEVILSTGIHTATYELFGTILPKEVTQEARLLQELQTEIANRESGQRTQEEFELPQELNGKNLSYRKVKEDNSVILLILGFILAFAIYGKSKTDLKQKLKIREEELLFDYAELVSKLIIYIGAGMTIGLAWEQMIRDYEESKEKAGGTIRIVYEEMKITYYKMKRGTPEGNAIMDFGYQCHLQPYLKLTTLLEQNRKTGVKNLRNLLQLELNDAWEVRKNIARRLGEEAGTKLLAPLFCMLMIVMVMIMVPAMMSMR